MRRAKRTMPELDRDRPIIGNAAWLLGQLSKGAVIEAAPLGLNPTKPTKWKHELVVGQEREKVAERDVVLLVQRGMIHGRAGSDGRGEPRIRFHVTDAGRLEAAKSREKP